uniref:2'-5'-oligoadenylate synthetase 1 domain-containing protein n=1 Tax=Strigamia maritima TaxID=126957 RepID=T1JEY7_STRMM
MSGIVFQVPKTKGAALQATVDGFEFDIVPAVNFSQNPAVQRRRVLEEIGKLRHPSKDGYRWSSSLIYDQVEFIKKQSSFAHHVIRLAKFWNRSIYIEEYVSGRSTIIELIAVHAAKEVERQYNEESLVRAMHLFFSMMRNLKSVNITFHMSYPPSQVENYVLQQRPLVLDPSNPYNNFAYDLCRKDRVRGKFEQFAQVSIHRLSSVFGLFVLFELQPSFLSFSMPRAKGWLVSVDNAPDQSKRIKVIERNVRGNHEAVKKLKHYICYNVRFLQAEAKSKNELKKAVQKSIDEMENDKREWIPTSDCHSDYDVTFEIPSGEFIISCSCRI